MNTRTTGTRIAAGAVVLAVLVAGTGSSRGADGPSGAPGPVAQAAAPAAEQAENCDTATSLRPAKNLNGKAIQKIKTEGKLVVGVDLNSYNWGYRDPLDGKVKGFDIDLAKAIAKSILGDENAITLKAVPTARRVEAVKLGEVDMVIRTMTITCERLKEVAFSAPYFRVSQSLVVPKGVEATTVAEGMHGKRVCAAASSSSSVELASGKHATAEVRIVENQLDCLVLMQLGEIDATLADTVLAHAQVAQDPMVHIVGEQIVPAFMGIAMSKEAPDLVAWVNAVLGEYDSSNGWQAAYDKWLAPSMNTEPGDAAKYHP